MIADVAFDVPIDRPFSYAIPPGWSLLPGQRVLAPLRGATRAGTVVAVRDGSGDRLKTLARLVDDAPLLRPDQLDLLAWIAGESFSSVGSIAAALLPPPAGGARNGGRPSAADVAPPGVPEILTGAGRERRLLERLASARAALVLTADVEGAGRWAQRLGKLGEVVRLDSGVADDARAAAWTALGGGRVALAVGTRSALLAPLPAGATVALVDEHEAGHKPPGAPRMHARDVVLERARREALETIFTSATPSAELWWRTEHGQALLRSGPPGPWPAVTVTDTRGILRREALTPALARAVRETLAAGRRVFLCVHRLVSALACDECGTILRCSACGIALAYTRASTALVCRLCAAIRPLPDVCPECAGRRLSPFGWSPERVEHAVRRRFPHARIARYDPDARHGARGEAQRAAAAAAEVVIGTRGALRLFGPGALGLAGFVCPDQLLRLPDFRAGERVFALLWAAAERVGRGGAVVLQSQHPAHYAVRAIERQDQGGFYGEELRFRAELGYPPFRRLAVLTLPPDSAERASALGRVLASARDLTVYPAARAAGRRWRIVVKGGADLPQRLRDALAEAPAPRGATRDIMDVEVDPVEWQF